MRQMYVWLRWPIGPHLGQLNNAPRRTPAFRTAARGAVAALAVFIVLATLAPGAATADTLKLVQGTSGHPFKLTGQRGPSSVGLAFAGGATITLGRRVLWSASVSGSAGGGGTGSVQWLPDGSALVCTGGQVEVRKADGTLAWSYGSGAGNPSLETPSWAWQFTRNSDGHRIVIIADSSAGRVFAVDRDDSDRQVWTYSGSGDYSLSRPVCAEYVARGTLGQPTVLIADDAGAAPKVLEVSWGDSSDVVWHYGGTPGTGDGQLLGPTDVERESDGSTLIADARADRVIRVDRLGTSPAWQFGVPGVAGAAEGYLNDPMGAGLESNGNVVIADTQNGRVIEVGPAGKVVWSSLVLNDGGGALGQPRLAERATGAPPAGVTSDKIDGALLVCDVSGRYLALVGNIGGGNVYSKTFPLASSGSQAHLVSLRVDASTPNHTSVRVHYYLSDHLQDKPELGPGTHSLRGAVTTTIRFDYWLRGPTDTDLWLAPALKDVVLTYTTGQTKAKGSGNGGASGGTGTASGSGTGTGTGVGGSGNGSGVGAGQGTGSDLGGSGTAASSGAASPAGGADLTVPAGVQPVASSAGGAAAGTVVGIPVNVGELSGGARGGGGGSPPPHVSRTAARLWTAAAATLLACLLGVPPLLVHRRLRRLGAFDHPDELGGWA